MAFPAMSQINHADIPAFLRSQGAIGQGGYQQLVNFGHDPATLQKVIRDLGITVGPALQPTMSGSPAPTPTPTPTPTPAPSYSSNFDQSQLARQLKAHGRAGGSIGMEGFQEFLDLGHGAGALEDAVKSAQKHGLKIGQSLSEYFKTGINPIKKAEADAAALARQNELIAATEAQSKAIQSQTQSMLEAADERLAAMADQSRMEQAAADQRAQAESEARRMQMIRDRGAGRSSNLQIGAPTVDKKAGGSANFRRRADQFRITPKFKGLSPIIQTAAQVASNSMVNI